MAETFSSTSTYSNLTRLELEALRRADDFAGGKALTMGDSGLSPEGVIGPGSVGAEPFFTGPSLRLDEVYPLTPPAQPGPGLLTQGTTGGLISEFVRWYGPDLIWDSAGTGYASSATTWTDNDLPSTFPVLNVQVGDILLIKPLAAVGTNQNQNISATVSLVVGNVLTLTRIYNPATSSTVFQFGAATKYSYLIIRPRVVQLLAVPGSGPVGQEQSYLAVVPGSTLHTKIAPTLAEINADRVTDMVSPSLNDSNADRADFVYDFGFVRSDLRQSLLRLGYRVVLYPDDGSGTGPDLTKPLPSLSPVIDPDIPASDQRMTIDYRAGLIRFSCAPALGGDIKVAGGTNVVGRLNLYAVFWAYDLTATQGTAKGLHTPRSTTSRAYSPARTYFDNTIPAWRIGTTTNNTDAFVKSVDDLEGFLSSMTVYPNIGPELRRSTEFGTVEASLTVGQNGLRYLSYRQGSQAWRFLNRKSDFFADFGYNDSELVLADKSTFTVGDASSPAQGPGGNLNPSETYGDITTGLRSQHSSGLTTDLAAQLARSPYGTVHLNRGHHVVYNAIFVPPGTTLEGEGPNTKILYRNFSPSSGLSVQSSKAVIKVGPNTKWGVYDASAWPDTASPYETALTPLAVVQPNDDQVIEGIDTVWNPVRRCWGVVWADVTSSAVFFNEVLPDGTQRFPGNGINIKDTVTPLFHSALQHTAHHTPGHYPRLTYQVHSDEYAVVWVESVNIAGIQGGKVSLRYFNVVADQTQIGWSVAFRFGASTQPSTGVFSTHPSIAAENYNVFSTLYYLTITCWAYQVDAGDKITASALQRIYIRNNVVEAIHTSTEARAVVSSTDVDVDERGNFLSVWSVRNHRLLQGGGGTLTLAAGESTFADPAYDLTDEGNIEGSKFHFLDNVAGPVGSPNLPGYSGSVYQVGATTWVKWEGGAAYLTEGPTVSWAITPATHIWGRHAVLSGGSIFEDSANVEIVTPANAGIVVAYHIELREADYVRLSRGAGGWCLAYQGFNSVAWPAEDFELNYDNNFNTPSPTAPGGLHTHDQHVYREHISTCYTLLRDDGRPTYPTTMANLPGPLGEVTGVTVDPTAAQYTARLARDIEVSLKSLGTRPPIVHRPNYQSLVGGGRIPYNETKNVSFQNYSYRWRTKGMVSCIPDITWTGQDWVIVSPAKPEIHSFTGNYALNGGNAYLFDVMFYFGNGGAANSAFGWQQRNTLPTGASIYFPASGTTHSIFQVEDEHCVQIVGHPFGGPQVNVEWVLVAPTNPSNAGIKNQGFRVNPQGQILTSTSFTTWADELQENDDDGINQREIELMRRAGPEGGNLPAQVAGPLPGSLDPLDSGSRYKADIGFRGVAPGRPKGSSKFQAAGKIAIAWGENLYGLFDHVVEDNRNALEFYRQSFGPYNVTLRNFSIEASPTVALQQLSQALVYTRHYDPAASSVSFDTDGFRNVFVYPSTRVVTWYNTSFGIDQIASELGGYYTDAKGQNPIRVGGATIGRGDMSRWMSDVSEDVAVVDTADLIRTKGQGVGPKVLWDGQRFMTFWIERANRGTVGTFTATGSVGYFVCMSYLAGDEDAGMQTNELVYGLDASLRHLPLAAVHISDGTGFMATFTNNEMNTVAVCDVAYSGKTYAVVWAAGLVPNYDPAKSRGSVLGVTIFNMDSAVIPAVGSNGVSQGGGGASYVIEQSTEPGTYHNPKILWDGSRYVVFYETTHRSSTATPPALTTQLSFTLVPEDGMARPVATKVVASAGETTGSPYSTNDPGTSGPFATNPSAFSSTTLGLGWAIGEASMGGGVPFYGTSYTVIQLWGTPLSPAIAAGVNGSAVATDVMTSAGQTFISKGTRPGDYLQITAGANAGYYMIHTVNSETSVTVESDWPGGAFGFVDAGMTYNVIRVQHAGIQPGDVLEVSQTNRIGTTGLSTESAGVYTVINYDPRRHQMTVSGQFALNDVNGHGYDALSGGVILGQIKSGGVSNFDTATVFESSRTNVSPRGASLASPLWATGASTTAISRLHGVVYNDVDDVFTALVSHSDDRVALFTINPSKRASDAEVTLSYPTGTKIDAAADIAWNGANYLMVALWMDVSTGVHYLQASLLNSRFAIEAEVTLLENTSTPGQPDFVFGSSPGQLPGPGYGGFPNYASQATGTVFPCLQTVKIRWNDRMARWVVAASVLWYDQAVAAPDLNGTYTETGLFTQYAITSWIGRTIVFGASSRQWQPGMKLAIIDGGGLIQAVVTIIQVTGGGPPYGSVIVDATTADVTAYVPGSFGAAVVREDVFCWTLGQDARGLLIEDADNVLVENVIINGGATDIEEVWPNMARPIWQSAGSSFGFPALVNFADLGSILRQPQYNHRFLTPAGKVNLPKYSNVTSSGRNPHGRKLPPGRALLRSKLRGQGE